MIMVNRSDDRTGENINLKMFGDGVSEFSLSNCGNEVNNEKNEKKDKNEKNKNEKMGKKDKIGKEKKGKKYKEDKKNKNNKQEYMYFFGKPKSKDEHNEDVRRIVEENKLETTNEKAKNNIIEEEIVIIDDSPNSKEYPLISEDDVSNPTGRKVSGSGLLGLLNGDQRRKQKSRKDKKNSDKEQKFEETSDDMTSLNEEFQHDLNFTSNNGSLEDINGSSCIFTRSHDSLVLTFKSEKLKNSQSSNTSSYSVNAQETKESLRNVTLSLSKPFLAQIKSQMDKQDKAFNNPFYTSGTSTKSEGFSFFKDIKERSKDAQRYKNTPALISRSEKNQTLKMRNMNKEEFHVYDKFDTPEMLIDTSIPLSPKVEYNLSPIDYSLPILANSEIIDNSSVYEVVPESQTAPTAPLGLWTDATKPKHYRECLIDQKCAHCIREWLQQSFELLNGKYQSKERFEYIQNKIIGKSKKNNDLDGFLVFDDELDLSDTEIDDKREKYSILGQLDADIPYVPLMIVHGPIGCGKTASIYSITQELNGFVHEINTNQDHNKRALGKLLKDLSTNRIVHAGQTDNDGTRNNAFGNSLDSSKLEPRLDSSFSNGVILFENVDVLFRQQDRGFWDLFNSILQITRKPVILTCSDLDYLPSYLLEITKDQKSFVGIGRLEGNRLLQYLKSTASSFGFGVSNEVLVSLITENSFDLRRCLTSLQLLCQSSRPKNNAAVRINFSDQKKKKSEVNEYFSGTIEQLSKRSELVSQFDVVSSNCESIFYTDHDEGLDLEIGLAEQNPRTLSRTHQLLEFEVNIGKQGLDLLRNGEVDNHYYGSLLFERQHEVKKQMEEAFSGFIDSRLIRSSRSRRVTSLILDTSGDYNIASPLTKNFVLENAPILRLDSFANLAIHHKNQQILGLPLSQQMIANGAGLLESVWYEPNMDLNRQMFLTSAMPFDMLLQLCKNWYMQNNGYPLV